MLLLRFGAVVGCNKTTQCTRHHADGIRALAMLGKALGAQLSECAPHVQRLCPHCSTLGFKPTCWPIAVTLFHPVSCHFSVVMSGIPFEEVGYLSTCIYSSFLYGELGLHYD